MSRIVITEEKTKLIAISSWLIEHEIPFSAGPDKYEYVLNIEYFTYINKAMPSIYDKFGDISKVVIN